MSTKNLQKNWKLSDTTCFRNKHTTEESTKELKATVYTFVANYEIPRGGRIYKRIEREEGLICKGVTKVYFEESTKELKGYLV